MNINRTFIAAGLLLTTALSGCSSTSSFTGAQEDITLHIRGEAPQQAPSSGTFNSTSFGNYDFMVVSENSEPLYGILPLKFHPERVVLDALFFAPGLFFNLRDTFPFYEIDLEQGVVRYKSEESDPWLSYQPTAAEAERAKLYFDSVK